jgi:hypothetical protein
MSNENPEAKGGRGAHDSAAPEVTYAEALASALPSPPAGHRIVDD